MRKWHVLAVLVVGLAVGGATVWLLMRPGSSGDHRAGATNPTSTSASTTSSAPGVAGNAQELLDRLDHVSKTTFHVRYETGSATGSQATIEVWHTADRVRRDIVAVSPTEGTAHTAEILAEAKLVRCVLFVGKPWQCVGAPVSQSGTLTDPLQGAHADVVGRKVTVSHQVIAGQSATCYSVAPAAATGKPSVFCLSKDDVPLRIDGGDGNPVDATNFDTNVPSSVFTPPAQVAGS